MIKLTGRVKSGLGNLSYWMNKMENIYTEKTGVKLFPGSLNVELNESYDLPKNGIIRIEKEEYGGTVSLSIQECKIFDRRAFIVRTDKNARNEGDHPTNIIEIACDVKLRDAYDLKDGDIVNIEV